MPKFSHDIFKQITYTIHTYKCSICSFGIQQQKPVLAALQIPTISTFK